MLHDRGHERRFPNCRAASSRPWVEGAMCAMPLERRGSSIPYSWHGRTASLRARSSAPELHYTEPSLGVLWDHARTVPPGTQPPSFFSAATRTTLLPAATRHQELRTHLAGVLKDAALQRLLLVRVHLRLGCTMSPFRLPLRARCISSIIGGLRDVHLPHVFCCPRGTHSSLFE